MSSAILYFQGTSTKLRKLRGIVQEITQLCFLQLKEESILILITGFLAIGILIFDKKAYKLT